MVTSISDDHHYTPSVGGMILLFLKFRRPIHDTTTARLDTLARSPVGTMRRPMRSVRLAPRRRDVRRPPPAEQGHGRHHALVPGRPDEPVGTRPHRPQRRPQVRARPATVVRTTRLPDPEAGAVPTRHHARVAA